jgi:flagellin
MKKILLILTSLAAFAGLASATVSYQVSANFNGNAVTTSNTTATISGASDTLTLTWINNEPAGPVTPPSNTTWGSLYVTISGASADTFAFTGTSLTILLTDLATGGTVTETGTFSGTFSVAAGQSAPSSSGQISWAPNGPQTASGGSTVVFTTDVTDAIGLNLGLTNANSTVNGTINSSAVPEPATFGMLGAALVGLGFFARKRKS